MPDIMAQRMSASAYILEKLLEALKESVEMEQGEHVHGGETACMENCIGVMAT